jgi:uncharacterized protein (DUF1778 family)
MLHRNAATTRINLRVSPRVKALLTRAAKLRRVNLTEFMIQSSEHAAEAAFADRTRFLLSPDKWREFNAALDAPPRDIPELRRLFKERSVFDSE